MSGRCAMKLLPLTLLVAGVVSSQSAKPTFQRPDVTRSTETRLADAYYIRAYEHGAYVIDHKDRRLIAKCRKSLYWPNGLGTFGTPVNDHDCVYMHELLGKMIGEDLMKQWKETLVYSPREGKNTVQTADYLDITSDEPNEPEPVKPQKREDKRITIGLDKTFDIRFARDIMCRSLVCRTTPEDMVEEIEGAVTVEFQSNPACHDVALVEYKKAQWWLALKVSPSSTGIAWNRSSWAIGTTQGNGSDSVGGGLGDVPEALRDICQTVKGAGGTIEEGR
jgi:hypothetical protein